MSRTTAPPPPLALAGEFTIYRAAELGALLRTAVAEVGGDAGGAPADTGTTPALVVDLSGVTEFDSAGVQLLIATARSCRARGATLRLRDPSAVVRDVFTVLELDGHFGALAA